MSGGPAADWPFRTTARRIALTGGSGRVGRALRQALAGRTGDIRIVDLADPGPLGEGESWCRADICDLPTLQRAFAGMDAIVHLAGYPNERSIEEILRVNVLGTHNVYEAARQAGIGRVVFRSSNHATGFYPRDTKIGVTDPPQPDSLYGLSKCWGELEAGLFFDKAGIRSLLIRIGNAGKQPLEPRSLAIWISARDLAQLVLIGLEHPDIDCTTVWGASACEGTWWDNGPAERLGYRPQDRALDHAAPEALRPPPADAHPVAEHFQGGRFCLIGHDGIRRDRR